MINIINYQIKTRHHHTPVRMATSLDTDSVSGSEDEQQELSLTADKNGQWYSHMGRVFGDWHCKTRLPPATCNTGTSCKRWLKFWLPSLWIQLPARAGLGKQNKVVA